MRPSCAHHSLLGLFAAACARGNNHLDMARNHVDDIEALINHEHKDFDPRLGSITTYIHVILSTYLLTYSLYNVYPSTYILYVSSKKVVNDVTLSDNFVLLNSMKIELCSEL